MTRRGMSVAAVRLCALAVAIWTAACGGSSPSPTSPTNNTTTTPIVTPTRIITVSGDMAFGTVNIGQSSSRTLTITNSGNATLTFTALGTSGGTGSVGYTASQTSGTIAAGGSVNITIKFSPTVAQFYSHVLTVAGDQTSGNNAINVSGTGFNANPIFTKSGVGDSVFDMPTYVARVRIQGTWNRTSTSNFIVRIAGSLVVNEILRDSITFDGTYLTSGGVVQITSSSQIAWTFTEIR